MKQTLIKALDEILRDMAEHPEAPYTESRIRSWLAQQGFDKRDIDAAIRLIRPGFHQRVQGTTRRAIAARPLTEGETCKLTTEARNALARLELYGLIEPSERETVLDRLAHFDSEVGLEELDYLLSWVVCGTRDIETQQVLRNVLRGRPDTLQ